MLSFFPLGTICSFYPQATRWKTFCTTVVINDIPGKYYDLIGEHLSTVSLFSSMPTPPPTPPPLYVINAYCLFWLCRERPFCWAPFSPKKILIRDKDGVQQQKLNFLTPPETLSHFLLLEKINKKESNLRIHISTALHYSTFSTSLAGLSRCYQWAGDFGAAHKFCIAEA